MSVIVYLITFIFIYATTSSELLREPGVYYLLLLLSLLMIGFWYELDTNEEVFPREHFRIANVPHQVAGGLALGMGFVILITAIGTVTPKAVATTGNFFSTLLLMVIVVGMVEVIMQIVYVNVVFLGVFIFPFLFAFTHPQIAPNWTEGIITQESVMFFIYAVSMAFVFIAIYLLRDYLRPAEDEDGNPIEERRAYKYFGAVAVATFHGVINAVSIFAFVSVGGVAL
jgi:hypothetical protein